MRESNELFFPCREMRFYKAKGTELRSISPGLGWGGRRNRQTVVLKMKRTVLVFRTLRPNKDSNPSPFSPTRLLHHKVPLPTNLRFRFRKGPSSFIRSIHHFYKQSLKCLPSHQNTFRGGLMNLGF